MLHHDHLLLSLVSMMSFSATLSSCFVSVLVDLCYDHVYRYGAELHTTSWSTINRQFVDITGDVLTLIDLILTISATSVEAERGFSVMKRVKTDYRNKLRNPAMNDLMRIILLSPSEAAFDPAPAIEHWYGALQRRQCCRRPAPHDVDSANSVEELTCITVLDWCNERASLTTPVVWPLRGRLIFVWLDRAGCSV